MSRAVAVTKLVHAFLSLRNLLTSQQKHRDFDVQGIAGRWAQLSSQSDRQCCAVAGFPRDLRDLRVVQQGNVRSGSWVDACARSERASGIRGSAVDSGGLSFLRRP